MLSNISFVAFYLNAMWNSGLGGFLAVVKLVLVLKHRVRLWTEEFC